MSIQIFDKRTILMLILSIASILILIGIWYKYEYSMDVAEHVEYNSSEYSRKLLIATQGSEFKNTLTKNVIEHYKNDSIYIKVIDVASLETIDVEKFGVILLIHTWENWEPPKIVEKFINGLSNAERNKLIVMTTSGQGSYKMEGTDAITGESNLNNIVSVTNQIIERLNILLKSKTL